MLVTMTSDAERWEPVPSYEGYYAVSDLGRVKSVARTIDAPGSREGRMLTERLRRFTTLPSGYQQVQLFRDGRGKAFLVHRLVLEAFVGPCPDGMEALHGEGGNSDNRMSNLRWGTHAVNVAESLAAGTHVGSATHCPHGHEYTPGNTQIKPTGSRACRACSRIRGRELAQAKKKGLPILRCPECQTVIPRPAVGRPPKWCSDDCRRVSRNARLREQYTDQKENRTMKDNAS